MSLPSTVRGATSDCETPFSCIVLKRDLKDAYKSGKFSSSNVKRSGGSVEDCDVKAGGATRDEGTPEGRATNTEE